MPKAPEDRNLQLRGSTYYCRVEINGRSERISLRTGDLAKARKKRDELIAKAQELRFGVEPVSEPTWDQAVVAYANAVLDRPGALALNTANRYRDSLRKAGPHLAGVPLSQIGTRLIGSLITARQATGVSNATVKRDLTAVSRVLAFATSMGLREGGNPAREFDRRFLSEDKSIIAPPTDREVAKTCELIADAHPQWPQLVTWLRHTGMRLGEALAAQRAHIEVGGKGSKKVTRLTLYKVKGARRGRMRTITLSPQAEALLDQLGEDFLFDHFNAERRDNVSTQWLKFRESREGMPLFRLHDLRHAYAVAALRADPAGLYRLSRHLGHSSVATTERYYLRFLSEEQQFEAKFGAPGGDPSQSPVTGTKPSQVARPRKAG